MAKRIFERLREEHSFRLHHCEGLCSHGEGPRSREMFVPLRHAPGEAQADFGEAWVVMAGVEPRRTSWPMDFPLG